MPRMSDRLWFDLDCNLYRAFRREGDRHFRGAWIAVTGLEPRERIYMPLSGAGLVEFATRTARRDSGPTIRVVVNERITCFVPGRVTPPVRAGIAPLASTRDSRRWSRSRAIRRSRVSSMGRTPAFVSLRSPRLPWLRPSSAAA
jgi:hypothetical protein